MSNLPTSSSTAKPESGSSLNNGDNEIGDGNQAEGTGAWGPWREASCRSGCTDRGRGFRERRRDCAAKNKACQGPGYDVVLCDDTKVFYMKLIYLFIRTLECLTRIMLKAKITNTQGNLLNYLQ